MKTVNNIQGFTLVELMIVVALIAILLMAAGPSVSLYLENRKVRNVAESIASGMQKARAHAINRGIPTEIEIDTRAANGFWTIRERVTEAPLTWAEVETFTWGPGGHNWSSIAISAVTLTDGNTHVTPRVTFNSMGRIMSGNLRAPASPLQRLDVGSTSTMTGIVPLRVEADAARGVRVCVPQLTITHPNDPKAC